jgi:hypothetical protein
MKREVPSWEHDLRGGVAKRRSLIAGTLIICDDSSVTEIQPAVLSFEAQECIQSETPAPVINDDEVVRQQYLDASNVLDELIADIQTKAHLVAERGPSSIYAFYERLKRLYANLNRTVSPLCVGRQRTPFLGDLCPAPQLPDQSFDEQLLRPWMESANRVVCDAMAAIQRQARLLRELLSDPARDADSPARDADAMDEDADLIAAAAAAAAGGGSRSREPSPRGGPRAECRTRRRPDPRACAALRESVGHCSDALHGRGLFQPEPDPAAPVSAAAAAAAAVAAAAAAAADTFPYRDGDELCGGGAAAAAAALSLSRMRIATADRP